MLNNLDLNVSNPITVRIVRYSIPYLGIPGYSNFLATNSWQFQKFQSFLLLVFRATSKYLSVYLFYFVTNRYIVYSRIVTFIL